LARHSLRQPLEDGQVAVREAGHGAGDAEFDYIVYGLRIGFEHMASVQPRTKPSPAPTVALAEKFYSAHPELREYNALARFKAMRAAAGAEGEVDLTRAQALLAAINRPSPTLEDAAAEKHPRTPSGRSPVEVADARNRPHADQAPAVAGAPAAPATTVTPACDAVSVPGRHEFMPVREVVEQGDVLVVAPDGASGLVRSALAADRNVVGVAVGPASDGLGPVAISGVVLCKADAAYGAIAPGDLLTTSPTPGHAMRAVNPTLGVILGKALEPLDAGANVIKIVVSLQ
jgi:hypothetical protein